MNETQLNNIEVSDEEMLQAHNAIANRLDDERGRQTRMTVLKRIFKNDLDKAEAVEKRLTALYKLEYSQEYVGRVSHTMRPTLDASIWPMNEVWAAAAVSAPLSLDGTRPFFDSNEILDYFQVYFEAEGAMAPE